MTYSINKDSVIFLDIDKENSYNTIAYDYKSDDVVAIRPLEYRLLKYVFENKFVDENQLQQFSVRNPDINEFEDIISKLVDKNILLANE